MCLWLAWCLSTSSPKLRKIWMNPQNVGLVSLQWEQERFATLLPTCLLLPLWWLRWERWASSSGICCTQKVNKRWLYRRGESQSHDSLCIPVQFCLPTCWGRCWTSWASWAACCACWEASFWLSMPQRNRKWHHCRTWPINCLSLVGWQQSLTVVLV